MEWAKRERRRVLHASFPVNDAKQLIEAAAA